MWPYCNSFFYLLTQNTLPHYSKKVPLRQRLSEIRITEIFGDKNYKISHAEYTQ